MRGCVCVLFQELHMGMIQYLYGRHYELHPFVVTPSDVGHSGTARERMYIIMAHKQRTKQKFDVNALFKSVSAVIRRLVQTKPSDYMGASEIDLNLESQHVARVRSTVHRPRVACLALCALCVGEKQVKG